MVIASLFFKKTMRPLVITKTTAIYRVTQNIATEEKKRVGKFTSCTLFHQGGVTKFSDKEQSRKGGSDRVVGGRHFFADNT